MEEKCCGNCQFYRYIKITDDDGYCFYPKDCNSRRLGFYNVYKNKGKLCDNYKLFISEGKEII